jgi:hypothetical protein
MPVKREVPMLNYHAMLMKGEAKLLLYVLLKKEAPCQLHVPDA